MRVIRLIISALLLMGCGRGGAENPCTLFPDQGPESWRPSGKVETSLSVAPWSADEARDAADAVQTGLEELNDFFVRRPAAVLALRDNAVEPFIDASYSASNMPVLQANARNSGRRVLTQLLTPYLVSPQKPSDCKDFSPLLDLAIYAHTLLPAGDARLTALVDLTNAAYHACGSLSAAIGYDYHRALAAKNVSRNDVWDLVMWSITLTDAQLVPGLEVPPQATDLPPTLWRFLEHYPLIGARAYRRGASDERFYDTAYLATHVTYIPTGYGRYSISVADSPGLYRFLRENFEAVLNMGELDLVAEFTDAFRQYGCTEQDDLQVREGTRYLLKLFHSAGDHWMAYREPGEPAQINDYNAVHKAWTGMSGVRARIPEAAEPGTYGGVVRTWLDHPKN